MTIGKSVLKKHREKQKTFIGSPLNVNIVYKKEDITERKVLEFDPSKIEPNEVKIVEVKKWAGLSKPCFAVLNLDGKAIIIKRIEDSRAR